MRTVNWAEETSTSVSNQINLHFNRDNSQVCLVFRTQIRLKSCKSGNKSRPKQTWQWGAFTMGDVAMFAASDHASVWWEAEGSLWRSRTFC